MPPITHRRRHSSDERGQMLVVFALAVMLAIIPGIALVLETGNSWAHERQAQNAADSVANAGATVLAQKLGGATKSDADVFAAMQSMASANLLTTFRGLYTNVTGRTIDSAGVVTTNPGTSVAVGSGMVPSGAQGVRVSGSQTFQTTVARAMGINTFTTSVDATAVTGALTGGKFMPLVFPVSTANCDKSGATVVNLDAPWRLSNPGPVGTPPHPDGQEWIVPLCKAGSGPTGSGSFMVLDLDPTKTCGEEVLNPTSRQFGSFPALVDTDVGNNCGKPVSDAVTAANLQGKVLLVPICDVDCITGTGSNAQYHIIRIAAFFLDYMSDSNSGGKSPPCAAATSPTYGTPLMNILGGNGSSSCLAGWFVRYITSGPVGTGSIGEGEAIGIQLIK